MASFGEMCACVLQLACAGARHGPIVRSSDGPARKRHGKRSTGRAGFGARSAAEAFFLVGASSPPSSSITEHATPPCCPRLLHVGYAGCTRRAPSLPHTDDALSGFSSQASCAQARGHHDTPAVLRGALVHGPRDGGVAEAGGRLCRWRWSRSAARARYT